MYVQLSLDGKLEEAFGNFCKNNNCQTNSEGFRTIVRNLPEFKELTAPSAMTSPSIGDNNHSKYKPDCQTSS
jgi:hypothetical protein